MRLKIFLWTAFYYFFTDVHIHFFRPTNMFLNWSSKQYEMRERKECTVRYNKSTTKSFDMSSQICQGVKLYFISW